MEEVGGVYFNIMEGETPHRFLAKACVEFASLFKVMDKIKNIDILKSHALYGDQLKNISIFEETHSKITPYPVHFIIYNTTQFIIGLFCQFHMAIEIEWRGNPLNLKFANNIINQKLVYCEEKDGRFKLTNREFP